MVSSLDAVFLFLVRVTVTVCVALAINYYLPEGLSLEVQFFLSLHNELQNLYTDFPQHC